jgi:DNA polymerase-3 subunit beta
LQRVQGIVEKRNTMPILANVLLESSMGGINVIATDLEIFIKDRCEANVKEEGKITVNARKIFEIVRQMPKEEIEVSSSNDFKVTLKSGKSRFNIVGLSASEFPAFPAVEEENLVRIDPEILKDMIDRTAFAVSMDETRYNINGFYMEKKENSTMFITTDGHRLAIIEKDNEKIPAGEQGVILPRKGVGEIRKLLEEKDSAFMLSITDKSATMKKDNTIINIRLIEGEFPDYKQVVPKGNNKKVTTNKTILLESLKRVSILSSDKVKGVKFSLSKNKLVLSTSSPELGDATEELEVEYQEDDLEIAFNAKYFIDVLEVMEEEKVVLMLKDQLSPGIVTPEGTSGYTYVIMPMRL